MATTLTITLRKKALRDGTFPIALRITKNRVPRFVGLGQSVKAEHWNNAHPWIKTAHPNSSFLNTYLLEKLNAANRVLMTLETETPNLSSSSLKVKIKDVLNGENTDKGKEKEVIQKPTFFQFANDYLKIVEDSGNYDRFVAERSTVNHIKRFRNNEDLNFEDVSVNFLKRFRSYLKGTKKLGPRTTFNHMILVRTIFKSAINEGIVSQDIYPFGEGKIRCVRPESLKIGLEENEIELLEDAKFDEHPKAELLNHARNVWLYSFYFAGMRSADVFLTSWSRFKNGRLYYSMNKNAKGDSVKIPDLAQSILDQYRNENSKPNDLVFPELLGVKDFTNKKEVQQHCRDARQKINGALKIIEQEIGLEKDLRLHVARHSFATIAADKIPLLELQKLFRHSSITTTINYMKAFMKRETDTALDSVINFKRKRA